MAQLAIPLMALGGFYIISNHNKNADEENEETIEKFTNNEKNIPINYPIVNNKSLNDNVNNYPNANQ